MDFKWNTVVDSFEGDERLTRVNLRNVKTNEITPIDVDSCFLFIGYIPNTEIFKGILDMNKNGYMLTNEKMETNIEGVFAAGDVADSIYRQAITSAGSGCMAALDAEKYLDNL